MFLSGQIRERNGENQKSSQGSLFSFAKDTMICTFINHVLMPILGMAQRMHRIPILVPDVIRFECTTYYIYDF